MHLLPNETNANSTSNLNESSPKHHQKLDTQRSNSNAISQNNNNNNKSNSSEHEQSLGTFRTHFYFINLNLDFLFCCCCWRIRNENCSIEQVVNKPTIIAQHKSARFEQRSSAASKRANKRLVVVGQTVVRDGTSWRHILQGKRRHWELFDHGHVDLRNTSRAKREQFATE